MKVKVFCQQAGQAEELAAQFALYGLEWEGTADLPTLEGYRALKGRGFDAVLSVPHPTGEEEFRALSEAGVKHVVTQSIGFDHFDRAAAAKYGIGIHHAFYPPESVAGYAVMLMLMCSRRFDTIMRSYAARDFRIGGCRGNDLSELTVGIVGTGKIGQCTAKRLRPFGCRILCCDVYESAELSEFCEYVPLEELLEKSDIVTLHAFSSPENVHMISAERLAMMKPSAYIVNTARGDLIDTEALIRVLREGRLAGAALDVVEGESGVYYTDMRDRELPELMAELEEMPEVILTQHMAFCTSLSAREQQKTAIEAAYLALSGKQSPYEIR